MTKTISVGRSPENDKVVEDKKVSAKHLFISQNEEGEYFLQDLGSTNGTFINEKHIRNENCSINAADIIKIGDTVLNWQSWFAMEEPELTREIIETDTTVKENSQTDSVEKEIPKAAIIEKEEKSQVNILLIGVIIIALISLILLLIWYFSNVVKPEITYNLSDFPKAIVCFIAFKKMNN